MAFLLNIGAVVVVLDDGVDVVVVIVVFGDCFPFAGFGTIVLLLLSVVVLVVAVLLVVEVVAVVVDFDWFCFDFLLLIFVLVFKIIADGVDVEASSSTDAFLMKV